MTLCLAGAALAGCQSTSGLMEAALPSGPNVEAKFSGPGGGNLNRGSAFLHDVKDGVQMSIWLGSVGPGEYRVAIHENGNCTSPNAFSAGPPYAPPGVPLAVVLVRKNDDTRTLNAFFRGYKLSDVMGRSVVVHIGASSSLEAQPGVPNGRVVCGVIGTPDDLFQKLGV